MIEITKKDYEISNFVEEKVCSVCGVIAQEIVNKNHKRDSSIARGLVWYILHYDKKFSIAKIAGIYYRSERGVKALISKTKHLIEKQKSYTLLYEEIKKDSHL